MKLNVYLSFEKDFHKMIKETPELERIITAYEKGLLTYTETLRTITEKYIEYTLNN